MIKKYLFAFVLLVSIPGFGQYLSFSEMNKILDFGKDTSGIDLYMMGKGFLLNTQSSDTNGFSIIYESLFDGDDYFVGLFEDHQNNQFTVIEYTKSHGRWEVYINGAKENGFVFSGMKKPAEDSTYFTYLKEELLLGLLVKKNEDGVKYQFSFTR